MSVMLFHEYEPAPIDTSFVDLEHKEHLVEPLAKNLHEIWARMRISEGWSYGHTRNDNLKHHPCLVPFETLSEADRAADMNLAREFLKSARILGF